jgi:hypothetical protein
MKEPELIDLFAMFAMVGLIIRNREDEDIPQASYEIAEQMMLTRDGFINSERE